LQKELLELIFRTPKLVNKLHSFLASLEGGIRCLRLRLRENSSALPGILSESCRLQRLDSADVKIELKTAGHRSMASEAARLQCLSFENAMPASGFSRSPKGNVYIAEHRSVYHDNLPYFGLSKFQESYETCQHLVMLYFTHGAASSSVLLGDTLLALLCSSLLLVKFLSGLLPHNLS
jgi:hypothetical protein